MPSPNRVFAATRDEALAFGSAGPRDEALQIDAPNLDTVNLEALATLLGTGAPELDGPIAMGEDWWLFHLGAGLLNALGDCDETSCRLVARNWAPGSAWMPSGGPANDVMWFLESLGDLARQARTTDRGLYFLMFF